MSDNEKKYISKVRVPDKSEGVLTGESTEYYVKDEEARENLLLKANINSPILTGTPKAPTPDSNADSSQIATVGYVSNAFRANDAMVFKGTIGEEGTITNLPTVYDAGWNYRVITEGTYAGKVCEVGDMLISVRDNEIASNASNDDWLVVQTNIDGAVTGSSSLSTNLNVAVFDGITGKIIKDGGKNVEELTNQNAFSNIKIGNDVIESDNPTDTVEFTTGVGLVLTGDTTNDKVNFKTKLKSETALANDSSISGNTANRTYSVAQDKSGYLAVNVPWTDNNVTNNLNTTTKAYITGTTSDNTNTDTQVFDTGVYIENTAGDFHVDGTINGLLPFGICETESNIVEKVVNVNGTFNLTNGARIIVRFKYLNTSNNMTLNVNNTGAKPIYYRDERFKSFSNSKFYILLYNNDVYEILNYSDDKSYTLKTKSNDYQGEIEFITNDTFYNYTYDSNGNIFPTNSFSYGNSIYFSGHGGTRISTNTSNDNIKVITKIFERITCITETENINKTVTINTSDIDPIGYSLENNGSILVITFTNAVLANSTLNINNTGAKPIYYKNSPIEDNIINANNTVKIIYNNNIYEVIGFLEDDENVSYISSFTQGILPAIVSNNTEINSFDAVDTNNTSNGSAASLTTDTLTWNQGEFPILEVDNSGVLSLSVGTLPSIKNNNTDISIFKAVNNFTPNTPTNISIKTVAFSKGELPVLNKTDKTVLKKA